MTQYCFALLVVFLFILAAGVSSQLSTERREEKEAVEPICTIDEGCPNSAMAWASGSLTEDGMLTEAAFQKGQNLTLHLHLCCNYKFRGEVLANRDMYLKFLVELLHISPLAHLTEQQQEAIFPHHKLRLTDTIGIQGQPAGSVTRASDYFTRDGKQLKPEVTDPSFDISRDIPDGDILTLVVQPQGEDFTALRRSLRGLAKGAAPLPPHRASTVELMEVNTDQQEGVESEGRTVLDVGDNNKEGKARAVVSQAVLAERQRRRHAYEADPRSSILMDVQLFLSNKVLKCKCPHTLHVLPLLHYRRDTLPSVSLEGLGPKCLTGGAEVQPMGPYARLVEYATKRRRLQQESAMTEKSSRIIFSPEELDELMRLEVTEDTIVGTVRFSLLPLRLPPFTTLHWTLYSISSELEASLNKASSHSGAHGNEPAPKHDGLPYFTSDYGDGTSFLHKLNAQLQRGDRTITDVIERAELQLRNAGSGGLTIVNESSYVTVTPDGLFGRSEPFPVRANQRYLLTVSLVRGEARRTLRGLFTLRLPAWMIHPAVFVHAKNGSRLLRRHNHFLVGRTLPLQLSQMQLEPLLRAHYHRVWAPMVDIAAHRARCQRCLERFQTSMQELAQFRRIGSQHNEKKVQGPLFRDEDHYVGFLDNQRRTAQFLAMQQRLRRELEEKLTLEADKKHAEAMADAECHDVFSILDAQYRRGEDLHLPEHLMTSPVRLSHAKFARVVADSSQYHQHQQDQQEQGRDELLASGVLPQHLHLRDPHHPLFFYDATVEYAEEPLMQQTLIVDHVPDGGLYEFPLGHSSLAVWIVDDDRVCNATIAEVADVYALFADVTRPVESPHTSCTREVSLDAQRVDQCVADIHRVFPQLFDTTQSTHPTVLRRQWSCYNVSRLQERVASGEEAKPADIAPPSVSTLATWDPTLKKTSPQYDIMVNITGSASATTILEPLSTARCFWTVYADQLPKLDDDVKKWLHIDEQNAVVTRAPGYFDATQDVVVEQAITILCRATSLPLLMEVEVDTKHRFFNVSGLPVEGSWHVGYPVAFVATSVYPSENERSASVYGDHSFELLPNTIFDLAVEEEKANLPTEKRTYVIRRNTTDGSAYIVLSDVLRYSLRHDETGVCPEVQITVVLRVKQTPPDPVDPAINELFCETSCVVLPTPRALSSDERDKWDFYPMTADSLPFYLESHEVETLTRSISGQRGLRDSDLVKAVEEAVSQRSGWFRRATNDQRHKALQAVLQRHQEDEQCRKHLTIALFRSFDEATLGQHNPLPASDELLSNSKLDTHNESAPLFARVCGMREGTSCGVRWTVSNAAGSVNKTTVVHRCRQPPGIGFYHRSPALQEGDAGRVKYDENHRLQPTLSSGGMELYPVAGDEVSILHYRLLDDGKWAVVRPSVNGRSSEDHLGSLVTTTGLGGLHHVVFEHDSETMYPYIANVTPTIGVPLYRRHNDTVRYIEQNEARRRPQRGPGADAILVSGLQVLPSYVTVRHHEEDLTISLSGMGNSSTQLFIGKVVVNEVAEESKSISTRLEKEFVAKRLCRVRRQPFIIYSLTAASVLPLDATMRSEAKREGRRLILKICSPTYGFAVTPEMNSILGYDFTWNCRSGGAHFSIDKKNPTETVITPVKPGSSRDVCTLTVTNRLTSTVDRVELEVFSVLPVSVSTFFIYPLADVKDELATFNPAELQQRVEERYYQQINGGSGTPKGKRSPPLAQRRRPYPRTAVGKSVTLVVHNEYAVPFVGRWRVTDVMLLNHTRVRPTFSKGNNKTVTFIPSTVLKEVRIEESRSSPALPCTAGCATGVLYNIPTSGIYKVAYETPDPVNGNVCPPPVAEEFIEVFLAEVVQSTLVVCNQSVVLEAVPLPLRLRGRYYGKWTVQSHYTSPTNAEKSTDYLSFENERSPRTVLHGLNFGVIRVAWSLYLNSTDEMLDTTTVVIFVLSDNLPSDRLVTFKDSTYITTTTSTTSWSFVRDDHPGRMRFEPIQLPPSEDPHKIYSGHLHLMRVPLGVTHLTYRIHASRRVNSFPAFAGLVCPPANLSMFEVERVSATITALTSMRVECDAYNGRGVVTLRLDTGGSDDIKFTTSHALQELVFAGSEQLAKLRGGRCRAPWWARREAANWLHVEYYHGDRAANITVQAKAYLSKEEITESPLFASVGSDCHSNGAFLSAKIVEGVPPERNSQLFVPIIDFVTRRSASHYKLRPIAGKQIFHRLSEGQLVNGSGVVTIAFTPGASFSRHRQDSLLPRCLNGSLTLSQVADYWAVVEPSTHRGEAAWQRYLHNAGGQAIQCQPLVYMPHSSSSQVMNLSTLEHQLTVLHRDTVQTVRTKDGINIEGLQRSTQNALAARRLTKKQLHELLERNRRLEAERLSRVNNTETTEEHFSRLMALAASVFGEEPVVTAVRMTLPPSTGFFTTEDILLQIQIPKAVICGVRQDDPLAPMNTTGFAQSHFGDAVVEDEVLFTEVVPQSLTQCQFENHVPPFHLVLRNGAFRSDASLQNCPVELIDDGVKYTEAEIAQAKELGIQLNSVHHQSISSDGYNKAKYAKKDLVGLHPCFEHFLRAPNFQRDTVTQKTIALRLSQCPDLRMINMDEYNSYEPMARSAFLERMSRPHHLRVVLKHCVIPDKHHTDARSRHAYLDATFELIVQPTMAHLRIFSGEGGGSGFPTSPSSTVSRLIYGGGSRRGASSASGTQLVDKHSSESDRLVLCEGDIKSRGVPLAIQLEGDSWHRAVGLPYSMPTDGNMNMRYGRGTHNVALLNSFSVVEKEEYLMMEDEDTKRARIARYVDRRYGSSSETFRDVSYRELGHASTGGTAAIKASKFMRYLYAQLQYEGDALTANAMVDDNQQPSVPRQLVRRINDSFVVVTLPSQIAPDESAAPSSSVIQPFFTERPTYTGPGSETAEELAERLADPVTWGFGGSIEEVRIAIPGVTTTCNACLLTDNNFFVAGDFSGSIAFFSQRAMSRRAMAEHGQVHHKLRLSMEELNSGTPLYLFHHWLCPSTAARRLEELHARVTAAAQATIKAGSVGMLAAVPEAAHTATMFVTLEVPLGEDGVEEEAHELHRDEDPTAYAGTAETTTMRQNITEEISASSEKVKPQVFVVTQSARAGISPSRIAQEAEVTLKIIPAALQRAHEMLSLALKKRKQRLGYSATEEALSFEGVVTVRTCLGGLPEAPQCLETASRGIVIGPWEPEAKPVVGNKGVPVMEERSYISEKTREIHRAVRSVRSGFLSFVLLCAHHFVTACVVAWLYRRNQNNNTNPAPVPGAPAPVPRAAFGQRLQGNLNGSGLNGSMSVFDVDPGYDAGTIVVGIVTFFAAAFFTQYLGWLWLSVTIILWAYILYDTQALLALLLFILHCFLWRAASHS